MNFWGGETHTRTRTSKTKQETLKRSGLAVDAAVHPHTEPGGTHIYSSRETLQEALI